MKEEQLKAYVEKRDLTKSPEPKGKLNESIEGNIFVIQKHNASNLHYDVRLEMDGVLKSWAVPKGPSTDPSVKRLAIETEDHPIEYADFEGIIPEGNYGAGEVIVWDKGTFDHQTYQDDEQVPIKQAYEDGKIVVFLHGEKLQGAYAFILMNKDDSEWLLIKEDDEKADARRNPVSTEQQSVMSDTTIDGLSNKKS